MDQSFVAGQCFVSSFCRAQCCDSVGKLDSNHLYSLLKIPDILFLKFLRIKNFSKFIRIQENSCEFMRIDHGNSLEFLIPLTSWIDLQDS